MCGTHAVSVFRQPENGFLDGLIASNAAQLEEGFCLAAGNRYNLPCFCKESVIMQYLKQAVAGAQILFVAFGAMVLVPLLTGLTPPWRFWARASARCCSNCLPAAKCRFFWVLRLPLSRRLFMPCRNGAWAAQCSACLRQALCISFLPHW